MAPLKTFLAASLAGFSIASPILERQVVTVTEYVSSPAPTSSAWDQGAITEFPIHSSCNATERSQLEEGLKDMLALAEHAKQHILRYGNSSTHYTRWFGDASSAGPIGWYERVLSADRAGALFRCDDADGNCARFSNYAGHWRGSNATQETVICPRSFTGIRWPLTALCGRGYTVANSPSNSYFGTDLLHRVLHVPRISEGIVDHFGEDVAEWLELAKSNPDQVVINSDTLQRFAVDVYAYDISLPGVGCTGELPAAEEGPVASSAPAESSAPAPTTLATSVAASETPSTTGTAAGNCHTHEDGVVHCV